MSELLDDLGELWDIVLDLLAFYHECCYNCQPFEGGEPVWLSETYDIRAELREFVEAVCKVNGHELSIDVDKEVVAEAFDEAPISCPNCGTEWNSLTEIGGEWLLARGAETSEATYLLTKAYWPFLTHYTKPVDDLSGLEVLLQIVEERRIHGSGRFVVDGQRVVALTECSPLEIMELLKAQGGRRGEGESFCWNRSKHGIAIRRAAAVGAGAVPVIHGDDRILECLPSDQRFRFVRWERRHAHFIDWTFEREFRVEGQVDLDQFGPREVVLIVADRAEQFSLLARRNVPPFAVIPFDFVFSPDDPEPRRTRRQMAAE